MEREKTLLEVKNLSITFTQLMKGLKPKTTQVIRQLDLTVNEGEITVIVGASGSGKSLLAHAILGILPKNSCQAGDIVYKGEPLDPEKMETLRGSEIALIPQSVNFLDPLMTIGQQVRQAVRSGDKKKCQQDIFDKYKLDQRVADYYPFQLSGGMARRVLVATAMVGDASLIIADEPTPGIDPDVLEETLDDFRELRAAGKGILFITHDIRLARRLADHIVVFYSGYSIETARSSDFTGNGDQLRHPYTKALYHALPENDFTVNTVESGDTLKAMEGCVFVSHCPIAKAECHLNEPPSRHVNNGIVRCFYDT